MREPRDLGPSQPEQPNRLGALRLIVAVSTIFTLSVGWWIEFAGGPIGHWAMRSPISFWLVWVLGVMPAVALAVAKVAARILELGDDD